MLCSADLETAYIIFAHVSLAGTQPRGSNPVEKEVWKRHLPLYLGRMWVESTNPVSATVFPLATLSLLLPFTGQSKPPPKETPQLSIQSWASSALPIRPRWALLVLSKDKPKIQVVNSLKIQIVPTYPIHKDGMETGKPEGGDERHTARSASAQLGSPLRRHVDCPPWGRGPLDQAYWHFLGEVPFNSIVWESLSPRESPGPHWEWVFRRVPFAVSIISKSCLWLVKN